MNERKRERYRTNEGDVENKNKTREWMNIWVRINKQWKENGRQTEREWMTKNKREREMENAVEGCLRKKHEMA